MSNEEIKCTMPQLAAAFTEWERRYREEPGRFMSEASKLRKETPDTYGDACARYLVKILKVRRALAVCPNIARHPNREDIIYGD